MQGLCRARVDPAAVKTAASAFSCKATTPRLHAPHVLTPTSTCRMAAAQQEAAQLSGVHSLATLLTDAHCHPQLDPANMSAVLQLKASRLAAMSVSYDVDWKLMQQLHQMAGHKIIPGFGIHPWWSHLHASAVGDTWQQLLEAPSQQQLQEAVAKLAQDDPVTNSGAYATNRPHKPAGRDSTATGSIGGSYGGSSGGGGNAGSSSSRGSQAYAGIHAGGAQQQQQECLGLGLRVVPQQEWHGTLRQLLQDNPTAIVGEIGIDRAASIPGTKVKTSLQHQMELLRVQVQLAAEFQRPVSVHCVRGYGHLLQFFSSLTKDTNNHNNNHQQQQHGQQQQQQQHRQQQHQQQQQHELQQGKQPQCPPIIMLHSYGGSVEEIPRFCGLPSIGRRFYFSFSHAINQRTPDKLRARIAAVPDDRLLIESDQVTPLVIDGGLMAICSTVADVKGWSMQEAADRLAANFRAFYAQQVR